MVFPGVQKSTWTRDAVAKQWYFHRFYDFQLDLNTPNPAVQAEILKIMGFWIQLGVSGFRMDAVPFVISTKGADVKTPRERYDMLRDLREFLQWRVGDSIILAKANVLPRTDNICLGVTPPPSDLIVVDFKKRGHRDGVGTVAPATDLCCLVGSYR
jgi:maltose alpha-D-glucosyltransferase / alpha-amylase